MQEKAKYTLQELYDNLPCTLVDLGEQANLNEVTVARIRDGKPTRRSTINRLLLAMSAIYHRPLNLENVTGVNVQVNKRLEKRAGENTSQANGEKKSGLARLACAAVNYPRQQQAH